MFHLRDRARQLNPYFPADVVARKTMSVVYRNHVFTIRHVLQLANWVSVPVKREDAKVLVELSPSDDEVLDRPC
jgi:hypothetical protein